MGRDAAQQIEARYRVSGDPQANALVNGIGRRVAAVSSRPNLPWQFKVLETSEVNAVSVPGYVYVNRGLLNFAGNDTNALAGVIAHEVAHTAARHAANAATKEFEYSLALQVLFGGANARQLGAFAANLAMLGYSRKDEYQADNLGVRYMAAAGYDPNGMTRFFRKLEADEGRQSSGLSRYFQTHPPTSSRITRVRSEIASMGLRVTS
jgi:predicted Zn-dependent protease